MTHSPLRFRQVHLDFHTSEAIPGVAAEFDPDHFAEMLSQAHVDSVTCFARCHHGWMYYDSKLFPERVHPNLAVSDLLKVQIEACHARGIRVPVYITVQWDYLTTIQHPEWRVVTADGVLQGTPPYEAGFYRYLCLNTPYVDFLKAHTREVLETLPVDGIFFDIVQPMDCSCSFCREGMESEGLEASEPEQRRLYGLRVLNRFKQEMTRFVRLFNPDCAIFYNAGHVGPRHRPVVDAYTHFEIESLPGGGWGYLNFPLVARFARTLGLECLGMTGKFHTSWGDFHSFKNPAALQYEVFNMLALGARCSIGDQLHPSGRMSQPVYDLIGSVYAEVEQKEPWCAGAVPQVDIGLFTPEEFYDATFDGLPPPLLGAGRMLTEGACQFDVVDSHSDLEKYRLLVLPDLITVSKELAARLKAYLAVGGALVASYRSGLRPDGTDFALPELGVRYKEEAFYSPDFLLPQGEIARGLPETEHVIYRRGLEVQALEGANVLANVIAPYFNRTYKHFISHRHTPSAGEVCYPGILRKGSVIYFAHPIFTQYFDNAPRWCKTLLLNAINLLLPEPLLCHNGPSTLQATVNDQPEQQRWVIHSLHYIPERRGQAFETIEDVIPLYEIEFSLRAEKTVTGVSLVPQRQAVEFKQTSGRVIFSVPKIQGHQMIEIRFSDADGR